jgi:hypothetical protein
MSNDDPNLNLGSGASAAAATVINSGDSDKDKRDAVWGTYGIGNRTGASIDDAVRSDTGDTYDKDLDVDQIIENGKGSLDWFHLVQARYALTGDQMDPGTPLGTQTQIDDLYFQQRGMKVNPLVGAANRISAQLGQIEAAHESQKSATDQLASAWQGSTGTAAHDKATELGTWSNDTYDEISPLPGVIDHAVNEIKKAVQIKVDAFMKLDGVNRINGVTMTNGDSGGKAIDTLNGDDDNDGDDDVSLIIQYSKMVGVGDNSRRRIQYIANTGAFGDNRGGLRTYQNAWLTGPFRFGVSSGNAAMDDFDRQAQTLCIAWTNNFITSAKGYFDAYHTLCQQTDDAIKGYLKTISDALTQAGHRKNPPSPSQTPASSSLSGSTPYSASTSGTPESSGTGTDSSASLGSGSSSGYASTSASGDGYSSTLYSYSNSGTSGSANMITSAFENLTSGLSGIGTLIQTAESAATQLSGIGSTVNQYITQGLGALTTEIKQGVDGFLGTHSVAASASDTTGKAIAEFDVAGKQMKLEQTKSGALELVLSDSDGKGKSYTLKLNEQGVPVITSEDEGASGAQGASTTHDTSTSHSGSGTQNSSDSQGASGSSSSATTSHSDSQTNNQTAGNQNSSTTEQPKTHTPSTDSGTAVDPVTPSQASQPKNTNAKNQTAGSQTPSTDTGAELPEAGPL